MHVDAPGDERVMDALGDARVFAREQPGRIEAATSSLRSTMAGRSTRGVARMPAEVGARRTSWAVCADAIVVLVGMQPRLRQVPPSSSRSTKTIRPCRAVKRERQAGHATTDQEVS